MQKEFAASRPPATTCSDYKELFPRAISKGITHLSVHQAAHYEHTGYMVIDGGGWTLAHHGFGGPTRDTQMSDALYDENTDALFRTSTTME